MNDEILTVELTPTCSLRIQINPDTKKAMLARLEISGMPMQSREHFGLYPTEKDFKFGLAHYGFSFNENVERCSLTTLSELKRCGVFTEKFFKENILPYCNESNEYEGEEEFDD